MAGRHHEPDLLVDQVLACEVGMDRAWLVVVLVADHYVEMLES